MSFEEFVAPWPCEIVLSPALDTAAFISASYRGILLREPEPGELDQYARLLEAGGMSKARLVEDLLGSDELHRLDRRLRVLLGELTITAPGDADAAMMPALVWPPVSAEGRN